MRQESSILINTVFGGGSPPEDQIAYLWHYEDPNWVLNAGPQGQVWNQTRNIDQQNNMYTCSVVLLLIAICNIPLMLCVRPCVFKFCPPHHDHHKVGDEIEFQKIEQQEPASHKLSINDGDRESREGAPGINDSIGSRQRNAMKSIEDALATYRGNQEGHSFGEILIHQVIETIEFVLGTVSNTASYLRLWALSLAHSQLSEVFLNLIFKYCFAIDVGYGAIILGIILWPIFWAITFFVLMLMDNLECTLHCLRLHWVECQNKFYKGEGYAFTPYNFKVILNNCLGA